MLLQTHRFDLVVHDGPSDDGTSLLVIRPCYLALRRALSLDRCARAAAIVVVVEPGRALGCEDITAVTGLPVIGLVGRGGQPRPNTGLGGSVGRPSADPPFWL